MNDEDTKGVLFDTIKYGYLWHSKRIAAQLQGEVDQKSGSLFAPFTVRWHQEDKFFYILEGDWMLIVLNDEIELRRISDLPLGLDRPINFQIKRAEDVSIAFARFLSLTYADQDDGD